jgi:hypothetical protein
MMRFLRRIFGAAAPESNAEMLSGGGQSRGAIVENRSPPIPGIIQVASADAIAQIFHGDAARQEMEYTRRGAHGGAISFNHHRRR